MRRALVLAALACAAPFAVAADFRSANEAAVLYDAPSSAARPLYVVSKRYPLEVIVNLEAWVKVRDHTGALAWVERRQLADARTALVTGASAQVRVRPEPDAPVAFVAAQFVALEVIGPASAGWLRVRHADGANGYVRADEVWGS